MDYAAFDRLVDERASSWTQELVEYCRIPSETGRAEELHQAAKWTAERLEKLGARTETVSLEGVPPLVLVRSDPGLAASSAYSITTSCPRLPWSCG